MSDPDQLKAQADEAFRGGDLETACALYQSALEAKPGWAAAHNNFAMALRQRGEREAAEAQFRAAIAADPDQVGALSNLGALLVELKKNDAADGVLARARDLAPDHPGVLYNCALLYTAQKDYAGAAAALEAASAINPSFAPALSNLGSAYGRLGRTDDAQAALKQALTLDPMLVEAHITLAAVLTESNDLQGALSSARRAVEIKPDSVDAHFNLGNALNRVPDYTQALIHFDKVLSLQPDHRDAPVNRGRALWSLGRKDEAIESVRAALAADPTYAAAHSNIVFKLQYDPTQSPDTLYAAARDWNAAHGVHPLLPRPEPANPDPNRVLRVGYLSPHLTAHPVGYFLEPVLTHHNGSVVEAVCYTDGRKEDAQTEKLRGTGAAWHQVGGLSDDALAVRIRNDGIDILIDLDGHTGPNRLPVFARRAAPLQVTWAGYVGTTGLDAMDYLITDHRQTLECDLALMTEQPVYMPGNYVTIAPLTDAPDVAPSPSTANGFVTFGCFNNLDKLNEQVIAVWARILQSVANSRLTLITFDLGDPAVVQHTTAAFEAHGIAADRLDLHGKMSRGDLLDAYNTIDIALDPFPYSGGLTTLEALWMGVPVITKGDGDRFAARHSVTHLTAAGLTECIAADAEEYVARAVALAEDPGRRADLRANLRGQMQASPACDGTGFTRNLEQAYRTMWQRLCNKQDAVPIDLSR